ncbi:MAG: ATP-binding protein, partial [Lachnospiraceae bacterium]|nr:ATP-binding protein [Lachnospiraceae bacterium]
LQALAYEKQNETMRQSLSTIRSLKHDMKNHLITLKAMYENQSLEGVQSYISKMMEEMEGTTNTLDSGNFAVDSIVNFKLQEMRMLDVNIQLNVKIPSEMNILAYDLTIVLGNLIDNALTALKQVPSKQQKDFLLHMQYNKGSLIIFMDNTYSQPLHITDGIYKTTKPEEFKHGLGISNVKNVISKYDGRLRIEHTDSKFSVSALIPFAK